MNREELYHGLPRIADRLKVGKGVAREWIRKGWIRAHKASDRSNAPWYCIESEISEDIRRLPSRAK